MDSSAESQIVNISSLYISAIGKSKSNNYLGKGRYSHGDSKPNVITLKKSVSSIKRVNPFHLKGKQKKLEQKTYDFTINTNIQFRGTNLDFNPSLTLKTTKIPLKVIKFKRKGNSISLDNSKHQNYEQRTKLNDNSPKSFLKLISKYNYSKSDYKINNQISYFPTEVAQIESMRTKPYLHTESEAGEKKLQIRNDIKLRGNQYEYGGKFIKKIIQEQVSNIWNLSKKKSMNLDELNLLRNQEKHRYKNRMEKIRLAITKR